MHSPSPPSRAEGPAEGRTGGSGLEDLTRAEFGREEAGDEVLQRGERRREGAEGRQQASCIPRGGEGRK